MTEAKDVRWFAAITYADAALVGGKNASLGEMYRELTPPAAARSPAPPACPSRRAPSDYLEVAKYLVELGIDSMSLSRDSVLKAMRAVVELERELGREVRQPEAA